MKPWLRSWMLAAAVMLLIAAAPARSGDEIVLTPIKVSANVYYFLGESGMASAANKGFMSNAGFVVTNDGVVIYDALATPALGSAMLKAIRKVTDKPIRTVIVGHYHADHVYGLQALKTPQVQILAHEGGRVYLHSEIAKERLAQRKAELFPWVDDQTRVLPADRWLSFGAKKTMEFTSGGLRFRLIDSSGAHSPEDLMLFVENDRVLFAGDLYFSGRIPFVGNADSRAWLAALDHMLDMKPVTVIPGHGQASSNTVQDMQLTRDYLIYVRKKMGAAVEELQGFEEAYAATDWSPFEKYPAFQQANRLNAFGTYILMEQESLGKK